MKFANTTLSDLIVSDTINFKTVLAAKRKLDKLVVSPHLVKIEICKKHWKELEKRCEIKNNADPGWSSLSGIKVIIKPYLKKVDNFAKKVNLDDDWEMWIRLSRVYAKLKR